MASVNKWIGIGNLGADPESRVTASGEAVCNISIACTETWRDKATGEKKEMTEWVRVGFFGKLAEIAGQYLRKGSQVYIEGSLRTRKWQDKNGQDRYTTEIIANEMKMLGGKSDRSGGSAPFPGPEGGEPEFTPASRPQHQSASAARAPTPPASPAGDSGFDDDIPF